jgi:hypothetical protein
MFTVELYAGIRRAVMVDGLSRARTSARACAACVGSSATEIEDEPRNTSKSR